MKLAVADFETFYSKEYSLSRMPTEDYVTDPRFEMMMLGVKMGEHEPVILRGPVSVITQRLDEMGFWDSCVVAHQAIFDMLIFKTKFNRLPKLMLCTRMMANALLKPYSRSVSLKACLEMLDLGVQKGDEVLNMIDRPAASLSSAEWQRYATYCSDDCRGTYALAKYLMKILPPQELLNVHLTLQMYLNPQLVLDAKMLAEQLQEERAKKIQILNSLPPNITKPMLMSNPKFAEVLRGFGIDPPMKISPTTGEKTYAFAKNDMQWKELEEEYADVPEVQAVIAARLSAKSTLAETRLERLLDIATRHKHFRVPIMYYAAHTGRDGGTEGINPQNFPRVDKSRMRFTIRAPKGFVVLAADLAQIEARITAMIAGQLDLVEDFRNKIDIYSKFASAAFGAEVVKGRSKEDDKRRFVGKTCILGLGFGMGWKKLRVTLRKDNLKFSDQESQKMVSLYRYTYPKIERSWDLLGMSIPGVLSRGGVQQQFGPVTLGQNCIILPNNMALSYPRLQQHADEDTGEKKWYYEYGGELRHLWGGKVLENIVQALARILIMNYQQVIFRELKLRPAIRQHDELDFVVQESKADELARAIGEIMIQPADCIGMPQLPVAVEINYGPTLGDCK